METGNDHAVQILLGVRGIACKQHRPAMRQLDQQAVMPGGVARRLEEANTFRDLLIAYDGLKGRHIDVPRRRRRQRNAPSRGDLRSERKVRVGLNLERLWTAACLKRLGMAYRACSAQIFVAAAMIEMKVRV